MAAHQAPQSLGFSRQEHWSGLPFPSPMHESEKWKGSHSVVSDSSWPRGLQPTRLLCPWEFPGKSTGMGCHCLLRQNFCTPAKLPRHPPVPHHLHISPISVIGSSLNLPLPNLTYLHSYLSSLPFHPPIKCLFLHLKRSPYPPFSLGTLLLFSSLSLRLLVSSSQLDLVAQW